MRRARTTKHVTRGDESADANHVMHLPWLPPMSSGVLGNIVPATPRAERSNTSRGSVVTKSPARTSPSAPREALELLYEAAKRQEKEGNLESAACMWDNLLSLDPTNGRAWVLRAKLAVREGDAAGARDILRKSLTVNPTNAILWQNWADLEKSQNNVTAARRLFRKALEANSELPSVYHSWGGLEYVNGSPGEARALYIAGLRKCPAASRLYHALGVLEDRMGRAGSARAVLTRGLELEPDNAYLHHAMGVLEYRQRHVPAARECFRRAIQVDPRHTLSWLSRAQLEEFEGNFGMARKYYEQGTSVRGSGAVQIWQAWARMEEKHGHERRALELYRLAVQTFPQDCLLYCSLGKLLCARGESTEAREVFARGLAINPQVPCLWQSLALLEEDQLHYDKARDIYARGVNMSSGKETAILLHAWAAMEWKHQNISKARELFQEAVKFDDSCSWLWLWFSRFEITHGSVHIARHYIARSIISDPNDGSPWRAWGELERSQGNEEKARFMFRRASELESNRALYSMDPESPLKRPWR